MSRVCSTLSLDDSCSEDFCNHCLRTRYRKMPPIPMPKQRTHAAHAMLVILPATFHTTNTSNLLNVKAIFSKTHFTQKCMSSLNIIHSPLIYGLRCKKGKGFPYWFYWALGLELTPVYRQSAHNGTIWPWGKTMDMIRYDIRSQNALQYVTVNSPRLMQRSHRRNSAKGLGLK